MLYNNNNNNNKIFLGISSHTILVRAFQFFFIEGALSVLQ